jgi:hypothetical protein
VFREDPAAQQRNLHDAEVLRVGGKLTLKRSK